MFSWAKSCVDGAHTMKRQVRKQALAFTDPLEAALT